ncbi:MAG: 5-oxoprolinase subunit PxpA [Sporomusaceae bacterium]|nr:5-oxoprolinase subunit PxpA [Sporomusaceae bacterium]
MKTMDLNCDMGESFGTYKLGYDEQAMPHVTSINVACGFHASDPVNMVKTVKLAKQYGVAIGAHPSYPDLVGFGRRVLMASPAEIKADVMYQVGALAGICKSEGLTLQHVKAHGALYNQAAKDLAVGKAIAEALAAIDKNLIMVCLANSLMVTAAKEVGIPYVEEAFADRAYTAEGQLVPRKQEGSVVHDVHEVAKRVLQMVKDGTVQTIDGKTIPINAQTVCVHGDTPSAVEMIQKITEIFAAEQVTLQAFGK